MDGRQIPIETEEGLMTVRLPPGDAVRIDFSYFPPGLIAGLVIAGVTAAVLLVLSLPGQRRRAVRSDEPTLSRVRSV